MAGEPNWWWQWSGSSNSLKSTVSGSSRYQFGFTGWWSEMPPREEPDPFDVWVAQVRAEEEAIDGINGS